MRHARQGGRKSARLLVRGAHLRRGQAGRVGRPLHRSARAAPDARAPGASAARAPLAREASDHRRARGRRRADEAIMRRRTRSNPGPTVRAVPESRTFVSSFEADTKTKATRLKSEVPGEWLAALLSLACELPIEDGAEAVANALVETIGRI